MKKYVVQPTMKDGVHKVMSIIEKPTGNVMYMGSMKVARPLVNQLNGGGGFNGYTPSFMFNRFIVNETQPDQNILVESRIEQ